MKFKLCAAAALIGAALVPTAQAANSVTLYGLVDLGLGYEKVEGPAGFEQSNIGMRDGVNSSSRWGLKGNEDLGGGLQAVFVLEGGFNARTGRNSGLFDRQATLALKSDAWGQLQAGRDKNFATGWVVESINPFGTSYESASLGSTFGSGSSIRYDNLLSYVTPNIGGFSLGLGYSFETGARSGDTPAFATNAKDRAFTAGARYKAGPLYLAAAYDLYKTNSSQANDTDLKAYMVGASYDFEVAKVGVMFGQQRDGWFKSKNMGTTPPVEAGAASFSSFRVRDGFKANSYMVSVTVPLGAADVFAAWQAADPNNDSLTGGDETMNVFSIGATYDLSKRTNLYAYGSYGDNWAFHKDASNQAVAVGIRHRF